MPPAGLESDPSPDSIARFHADLQELRGKTTYLAMSKAIRRSEATCCRAANGPRLSNWLVTRDFIVFCLAKRGVDGPELIDLLGKWEMRWKTLSQQAKSETPKRRRNQQAQVLVDSMSRQAPPAPTSAARDTPVNAVLGQLRSWAGLSYRDLAERTPHSKSSIGDKMTGRSPLKPWEAYEIAFACVVGHLETEEAAAHARLFAQAMILDAGEAAPRTAASAVTSAEQPTPAQHEVLATGLSRDAAARTLARLPPPPTSRVSTRDLSAVVTHQDFGVVLSKQLRNSRLSLRRAARLADMPLSTLGGWCSGRAVPHPGNPDFRRLLENCLELDGSAQHQWIEAVHAVGQSVRSARTTAPFKGQTPYGVQDADRFFGRTALIETLKAYVQTGCKGHGPQVVVVTGPSGSGKTSLLCAGLLPTYQQCAKMVTLAPDSDLKIPDVGETTMLVVDRFEQALHRNDAGAVVPGDLAMRLLRWAFRKGPPHGDRNVLVLGVREDFCEPVMRWLVREFEGLIPCVSVAPMKDLEATAMIAESIHRENIDAEPDIPRDPTHPTFLPVPLMPWLSYSLASAWKHRTKWDKFTVRDFHIGKRHAAHTAGEVAERAVSAMADAQREATRRILLSFYLLGNPPHPFSAAALPRGELAWTDVDPHDVDSVLEQLAAAYLIQIGSDRIEFSTECFIHCWPQLRVWVDEANYEVQMLRRLHTKAAVWSSGGFQDSDLLRGTELQELRLLSRPTGLLSAASRAHTYLVASTTPHEPSPKARNRWTARWRYPNTD